MITSNSEKHLPDAFLRRCVFYHIPFPTPCDCGRSSKRDSGRERTFSPSKLDAALEHFVAIRELGLKKQPATAESSPGCTSCPGSIST